MSTAKSMDETAPIAATTNAMVAIGTDRSWHPISYASGGFPEDSWTGRMNTDLSMVFRGHFSNDFLGLFVVSLTMSLIALVLIAVFFFFFDISRRASLNCFFLFRISLVS
jgi:hypothetical protein